MSVFPFYLWQNASFHRCGVTSVLYKWYHDSVLNEPCSWHAPRYHLSIWWEHTACYVAFITSHRVTLGSQSPINIIIIYGFTYLLNMVSPVNPVSVFSTSAVLTRHLDDVVGIIATYFFWVWINTCVINYICLSAMYHY